MNIPNVLRRQTVTQAAIIIAVISFISKFFGFFREVLVAKYFGATGQTDAFLVAMLIPISILGLFAAGFSTLVIPYYLEKKAKGIEAAKKFVNSAFTVWGMVFILLSILIFIFAPICVRVIAYGFKGERFALAVTLTRYLIISGLFTVLSGMFTGIFQAEKQFFFPIFITFLGNVALVFSLFFLHRYLGLHSWTVGQILNASIAFFAMFFMLWWRYKFFHTISYRQVDWREIRQFALLLLPLVISGGISMLNQIVDKTIASSLDAGSIAALNFAQRVWGIPISLLSTPIATAIFPTFSELALNGSARQEYEARLQKTLAVSFYLVIPSTVFIYFLAQPIVRLFFERGAFDVRATSLTAFVLQMYVFGLFGHAISPILSKVFYSFKNTVTPVIIGIICVALNVILNIVLSKIMGAAGIALATSIVMILNFVLYSLFLKKYLNPFPRQLATETIKIILSSIPVGLICYFSLPYFHGVTASTLHSFASLAIKIAVVGFVSIIPFFAFSHYFKLESYAFIKSYALSILKKIAGK
ncbi:MAG: murein biosynthesis integral membrane protein MurJ [Candidatus Saccharicenans sp.]